jgi:hypothetical protein
MTRRVFDNPATFTDLPPLDRQVAQAWMDELETRLRPHVVAVPNAWRKGISPTYTFPRECFSSAVYYLHRNPDLPNPLYVIGKTIGGGRQHGWVEVDGSVVFDGVMQEFYDKSGYYSAEKACPWYRFTRAAVMYLDRRMRRDSTMTWAWHVELVVRFANPAR